MCLRGECNWVPAAFAAGIKLLPLHMVSGEWDHGTVLAALAAWMEPVSLHHCWKGWNWEQFHHSLPWKQFHHSLPFLFVVAAYIGCTCGECTF